jgi:multicomponent K+:H+ antiporter subunit A
MTALAILLQAIASDLRYVRRVFRVEPRLLAGIGLSTSLYTGLVPMLFGYPSLTSTFGHLHAPWLGDIEVASAFFFDLGVYCVVVGETLLMIMTLAEA